MPGEPLFFGLLRIQCVNAVRATAPEAPAEQLVGSPKPASVETGPRDGKRRLARGGALRTRAALRRKANWIQLLRFGLVGASGYIVNLSVFAVAVEGKGISHRVAALIAFLAAVTNNFVWNRRWTFAVRHGRRSAQAMRFLLVSTGGLFLNVALLELLVSGFNVAALPAQALAVAVVMPVNFLGNRLWTFARRT